jgi:hypothetical protein
MEVTMQAYARRNKNHAKFTERDYLYEVDGHQHAMHAFHLQSCSEMRRGFGKSSSLLGQKIFRKKFEERLIAAYSWRKDAFLFSFGL